jgi:MoaA/NifB/PqqE/SkfB family radical SAM enzyme
MGCFSTIGTKMIKAYEKNITNSFCNMPFNHLKINVEGNVTMCCYQGSEFIGNIFNQGISEIWSSKLAREIRNTTKKKQLHSSCTKWGACPHVNKKVLHCYDVEYNPNFPTSIEIDLPSTHCNIGGTNPNDENPACIMCPRNSENFRSLASWKIDNTEQILEKISPIMPYLTQFCVLGIAEPFWKDAIFYVFEKINFQKHKKNIFFWTFTNGSIFNNEKQTKFLEQTTKSRLNFSIDAASKETYQKIRRRDFFEIIKQNLISYNKKKNKEDHQVFIHNNINILNMHEMPKMVEFAKDVEANGLVFTPTHDAGFPELVQNIEVKKHNLHMFLKYQEQAQITAKNLQVNLNIFKNFEQITEEPELVQINI